jgi:hypothetical protein
MFIFSFQFKLFRVGLGLGLGLGLRLELALPSTFPPRTPDRRSRWQRPSGMIKTVYERENCHAPTCLITACMHV